jgi:hypothetical protein
VRALNEDAGDPASVQVTHVLVDRRKSVSASSTAARMILDVC